MEIRSKYWEKLINIYIFIIYINKYIKLIIISIAPEKQRHKSRILSWMSLEGKILTLPYNLCIAILKSKLKTLTIR